MSDNIDGVCERITFQNDENGFTVAWFKIPRERELICAVGTMTALRPGETAHLRGEWQNHLVHGRQLQVTSFETRLPQDVEGIRRYLGSGLVKGIGPAYAKRIVAEFGPHTLNIIDQNPERLLEVEGIGKKRVDLIRACWDEQRSIRDVMVFLQGQGISPAFAQRIYRVYGDLCIKKIKENPYNLANDIIGIGFKSADKVAENMGIEKHAPQRIDSGILYALSELGGEGHVCYPVQEFVVNTAEMLQVDAGEVQGRIEALRLSDLLRVAEMNEEKFVWPKKMLISEMGIAKEIGRLKRGESLLREIDTSKAVDWVQEQLSIELATHQKLAVKKSVTDKCHIITGGPGTGKSTITNCILRITQKLTSKILLAAPTGKAAKRMAEITGKKASTIHSLLEFDYKTGGFKRGKSNQLECDLLVVDEASMIDTALMYSLLQAIPSSARVVFVGDVNQLPSVGPGNVLKELIESRSVAVTELKEIFRQASGSRIITNAHRINDGIFPELKNEEGSDFFFVEMAEPQDVLESIVNLVTKRLPKKFGFDPIKDIQVLAPMKKGIIGTENLNLILQERLVPQGIEVTRRGRKYRIGDKVMQLRNNYDKEIFNGDVGAVRSIDSAAQQVVIDIDGVMIDYDFAELDEINLAYAVSIHKYQGSETPCVVIPVHTTHFKMLYRNLLYTGVTRGKKLVVLVGTKKAVVLAVKNDEVAHRYTGLKAALHGSITQIF